MEYKDEIDKGKSRVPAAQLRKTLAPMFADLKAELNAAIVKNKVKIEPVDVDRVVKNVRDLILSRDEVSAEDIHKYVDRAVDNLAKSLPEPQSLDVSSLADPINKAVDEIKKYAAPVLIKSLVDYRPHDQDIESNVYKFYGFVHFDGSWYIVRDEPGAGVQRYAAGLSDYALAWKTHQKLTYGYINEVM